VSVSIPQENKQSKRQNKIKVGMKKISSPKKRTRPRPSSAGGGSGGEEQQPQKRRGKISDLKIVDLGMKIGDLKISDLREGGYPCREGGRREGDYPLPCVGLGVVELRKHSDDGGLSYAARAFGGTDPVEALVDADAQAIEVVSEMADYTRKV
jgi:hypothetical protein